MKKNWNRKKIIIENLNYAPEQGQNKYYKNSFYSKNTKNNKFYNNKKTTKFNYSQKNEYAKEQKYSEMGSYESFYPQNYKISSTQFENKCNNNEKNNNEFFNCELAKNNNYEKNKNEGQNENLMKQSFDNGASPINEDFNKEENIEKEEKIEKPKKYGIKSIPHPKRKKGHRSCYIPGKKIYSHQPEKEEEENVKKERKLSISSSKTNFDSAKHSISTLNTSSSTNKEKEKDVLNEGKINITNDNQINIDNNSINSLIYKNKFDENIKNEIKQYDQINPHFENTEILKVNVKVSDNKTVIFKLRRFDDLFFTIKLFCEINSIDEKFIKPLIIKSLSTINTIYQIYNCQIESKNISILKIIKNIDDIQK